MSGPRINLPIPTCALEGGICSCTWTGACKQQPASPVRYMVNARSTDIGVPPPVDGMPATTLAAMEALTVTVPLHKDASPEARQAWLEAAVATISGGGTVRVAIDSADYLMKKFMERFG